MNVAINYQLRIDENLLRAQIRAMLESNIPEDKKEGLHHLLGAIYDQTYAYAVAYQKTECPQCKHLIKRYNSEKRCYECANCLHPFKEE